jgi:hypothetical protein
MADSTVGGDDTLQGGADDDEMFGDAGGGEDDAQGGNDALLGGDGNDFLVGDFQNALGNATGGDDLLDGGPGDDDFLGDFVTNGGTGAGGFDTFLFGPDSGLDRIFDFEPGKDVIDLSGVDTTNATISDVGADLEIDIDGGGVNVVRVLNVNIVDLQPGDIVV